MTVAIEIGRTATGEPASLDLEELLATRLLVQGNSGSGKSHLLRRLLEQSVPWVQQAVIDPEGDFATLAEQYGHLVIDAEEQTLRNFWQHGCLCKAIPGRASLICCAGCLNKAYRGYSKR